MKELYQAGLIGCGDFLRWLIDDLNASKRFRVARTFDIDKEKSARRAKELNAIPVEHEDAIFQDPNIDIVLIFTPPWVRVDLVKKAVKARKHIITTKPLANNLQDALKIEQLVKDSVECAVIYGRTGNPGVECLKTLFKSGEIGKLALYKEDWFHHYPTWNNWATLPEKNGGPFMDAMIHNLNKAIYLTGDEVSSCIFFSDNHAQQLACNDTESLKVNFEGGASAHLFITWAADLEVYAADGNDREHIGIAHMITDEGWYVTEESAAEGSVIRARKDNKVREWPVEPLPYTPYDDFVIRMERGEKQNSNLEMAVKDIEILEKAMGSKNAWIAC